jgi:glycosyltransferase involved in cell wall biosynthesis
MNCYNGEKYLRKSLDSVINQDYKNWELIFYDNASTDSSKEIFLDYKKFHKKFKYFKSKKKENLGLARLNAFKKIKGNYFLFLDCDDYILPNKLSEQIKLFTDNSVGAVYSNSIFFSNFFNRKLYPNGIINKKKIFYDLIENYNISLDTIIFKTAAVKKLSHSLDPKFDLVHDLDLIIRLSKIFEIVYCPKILSYCRIHNSSTSNNAYLKFVKEKKIFEKKIINLYPKDEKLIKLLPKFREKYYVEECFGYLLECNNETAKKLIKKINRRIYKFLLFIFCYIPFSNFLIKCVFYINKKILLK